MCSSRAVDDFLEKRYSSTQFRELHMTLLLSKTALIVRRNLTQRNNAII
jgi:hypothetical protein